MKLKFVEAVTVYPDGAPKRFEAGDVAEFDDDYAALLIQKGHAVADSAPEAKPEAQF